jgi:hypothetical protein
MKKTVLASFEDPFGTLCVDVFVRSDGSFGFEEFRRMNEDGENWQNLNKYSHLRFASGEASLRCAQEQVSWLSRTERWRW